MIRRGFIQKEQDPILKIQTDQVNYIRAEEDNFLARLFNSKTYLTFYVVFTFYALFGDDFRQLAIPAKYDFIFYFLMSLTCIFFTVDIILGSSYSKLYRFSVLFYMDVISVCFLLFDIGPINQLFFNKMSLNVYGVLARGARAVLIGFPIYKKLKNFKGVFRGVFSQKTYRNIQINNFVERDEQKQRRATYEFQADNINNRGEQDFFNLMNEQNTQQDQKIIKQVENTGHQLTSSFQMKIVIGVFILMYLLPIFWIHTYFNQLHSFKIGIIHMTNYLDRFGLNQNFDQMWQKYVQMSGYKSTHYEFLKLELLQKDQNKNFVIIKQEGTLDSLDTIKNHYRYYELRIYTNKDQSDVLVGQYYIRGVWQIRQKVNLDSWLSIMRTIFFLILIISLGIVMSKDINDYFTEPFYKLMSKVKIMHENALSTWDKKQNDQKKDIYNYQNNYTEIDQLRQGLVNCSKLLQSGLGEAGVEIVKQNLKLGTNLQNSETSLKDFLKAKKVYSIFGFIYINQFQEQAELLGNNVCDFVNYIADLVHSNLEGLDGKVNKNIGEAFLIVWKSQDEEYFQKIDTLQSIQDSNDSEIDNFQYSVPDQVKNLAENAIYAFIKIVIKFSEKPPHTNNKFKHLLENFQGKKTLSLGLHFGWAIEGAIGSKHKIDASYLSPHVNLASRVTAACSQYKVPLLISHKVVRFISEEFRQKLRQIDKVYLKGSRTGILLYTFDMNLSQECINQIYASRAYNLDQKPSAFIQSNMLKKLKSKFDSCFFNILWKAGFMNYQKGNWKEALDNFEKCLEKIGDDGPSINLTTFIKKNNLYPPRLWNGTRKLLEK